MKAFMDKYAFLSNFYPSVVSVPLGPEGDVRVTLPTVEHAYVVMKAGNWIEFERRANTNMDTFYRMSPGRAKRLGRRIKLRPDWEDVKLAVMEDLIRQKFFGSTYLRGLLVGTRDTELVELNDWGDTFWGVCNGVGQNWLGRLLMKVRKEIHEQDSQ